MKKENKIILIVCIIIFAFVILSGIFVLLNLNNKENDKSEEKIYNKEMYLNVTLPSISGNENVYKDEFGKKTNISNNIKEIKKWMNLDFCEFNIYTLDNENTFILFEIVNNNNMIIETGKFQLQLKDNNQNIVSIINFDELVLTSGAKVNVTVDIEGDVTNVKDIVIDEINYTMELKEVN